MYIIKHTFVIYITIRYLNIQSKISNMKTIITSLIFLLITTISFAQRGGQDKSMKYSQTYHANVFLNVGAGLTEMNTGIMTTTGEVISLSAGGGARIGLQLGYTMPTPSIDFSISATKFK